jgi:tryptophanyl-tRNA synthetase
LAGTRTRKTVFSGIQPTGEPNPGSLIGALSPWVRERDRHDNIFRVVDLHALEGALLAMLQRSAEAAAERAEAAMKGVRGAAGLR